MFGGMHTAVYSIPDPRYTDVLSLTHTQIPDVHSLVSRMKLILLIFITGYVCM